MISVVDQAPMPKLILGVPSLEKSEKKESKRYLHQNQSRMSSPLQPQTPERAGIAQERLQMICQESPSMNDCQSPSKTLSPDRVEKSKSASPQYHETTVEPESFSGTAELHRLK